jgi:hypothetical protein
MKMRAFRQRMFSRRALDMLAVAVQADRVTNGGRGPEPGNFDNWR